MSVPWRMRMASCWARAVCSNVSQFAQCCGVRAELSIRGSQMCHVGFISHKLAVFVFRLPAWGCRAVATMSRLGCKPCGVCVMPMVPPV